MLKLHMDKAFSDPKQVAWEIEAAHDHQSSEAMSLCADNIAMICSGMNAQHYLGWQNTFDYNAG